MIVDVHTHAFPPLGEASGYDSPETHLKYIQRTASSSDHMRFKGELPRPDEDVQLKIGKYRMEWIKGGEKCFLYYMAPTIVNYSWPPEHMLASMDWVGVQKGVLYQAHIYGHLNDYLAECVKKWPDRFAAVAQVEESRAWEESELSELRRSITTLGLKGLYFEVPRRPSIEDERYYPLWNEVLNLKVPVVLELGRAWTAEEYLTLVSKTAKVLRKFPDLKVILETMGANIRDPKDPQYVDIPKKILHLITLPNVWYEIGYLLGFDKFDEYPYPLAQKVMREAYEAVGADNLVWGSDMPMLMRTCTYRQAIDFVRLHCNFLSEAEKDLVLGKNAAKLLDL